MISAEPEKNTTDFVLFTPEALRLWVRDTVLKKKKIDSYPWCENYDKVYGMCIVLFSFEILPGYNLFKSRCTTEDVLTVGSSIMIWQYTETFEPKLRELDLYTPHCTASNTLWSAAPTWGTPETFHFSLALKLQTALGDEDDWPTFSAPPISSLIKCPSVIVVIGMTADPIARLPSWQRFWSGSVRWRANCVSAT